MMDPRPCLHTERLLLRPPTLDDFESWAALAADADNTRYIGGVQPRARRHIERRVLIYGRKTVVFD